MPESSDHRDDKAACDNFGGFSDIREPCPLRGDEMASPYGSSQGLPPAPYCDFAQLALAGRRAGQQQALGTTFAVSDAALRFCL